MWLQVQTNKHDRKRETHNGCGHISATGESLILEWVGIEKFVDMTSRKWAAESINLREERKRGIGSPFFEIIILSETVLYSDQDIPEDGRKDSGGVGGQVGDIPVGIEEYGGTKLGSICQRTGLLIRRLSHLVIEV